MWTSPGWAAKTRSAQPLMIRLEAALLQPHWLLHFNVNAQRERRPPSKAPHQSNTNIYTSLYGSLKLTQPCFLSSRSAPETHSIMTPLGFTSAACIWSLQADSRPWLGLISSLCAFEWHKPNSQFVCFGCSLALTIHANVAKIGHAQS